MHSAHSHAAPSLQIKQNHGLGFRVYNTIKCFSGAMQCRLPLHRHLLLPRILLHDPQLDALHNTYSGWAPATRADIRQTSQLTSRQGCLLSMYMQPCFSTRQCCFQLESVFPQFHAQSLWPPDFKSLLLVHGITTAARWDACHAGGRHTGTVKSHPQSRLTEQAPSQRTADGGWPSLPCLVRLTFHYIELSVSDTLKVLKAPPFQHAPPHHVADPI